MLTDAVMSKIRARNKLVSDACAMHTQAVGMAYKTEADKEARKEAVRQAKEEAILAQAKARREYQEKQARLVEHTRVERIRLASKSEWFALFDKTGADEIYEAIAQGHEVASYGRERGFPLSYFGEWCAENLDRKKVISARRAAAELAAYDSVAIFSDPDSRISMQAVHHVRALAQHKTWHAERKDAETWGPPKSVAPPPAPVALVVSIDGLSVPAAHLDRVEAKRAEKLRLAAPVFDPNNGLIDHEADEADEVGDG